MGKIKPPFHVWSLSFRFEVGTPEDIQGQVGDYLMSNAPRKNISIKGKFDRRTIDTV